MRLNLADFQFYNNCFIIHLGRLRMNNETKINDTPIELLKTSYEKMSGEFLNLLEQKSNLENLIKYHATKFDENLNNQKQVYQNQARELNKKISQMQGHCKKLENEESQKNRKECRKYVEAINEQDIEINSLKRQINGFKNKIAAQQQEINNLNSIKQNFEVFVFKGIDQIKSSIKESYHYLEELQTEKMVLESKFRQLSQKQTLLQNQRYETEAKKNTLEQNYEKLKSMYKSSRQQYIDLKYEISKLKENSLMANDTQMNWRPKNDEQENFFTKELQSISELNSVLQDCESYLKQANEFMQMNRNLGRQNVQLKQKATKLQLQIDQLKCRYITDYENEYLKNKQPSLYGFLVDRKQKFQHFQASIQNIEIYIQKKDNIISDILKMIMEKEQSCNCGKEEQLNRLKGQLQAFQKKYETLMESTQKSRKEKNDLQQRIDLYKLEIKNLIAPLKGKKRTKTIRCGSCLLQIQKNEKSQVCRDCKRVYHVEKCSYEHQCGSFILDDNISQGQSDFFV